MYKFLMIFCAKHTHDEKNEGKDRKMQFYYSRKFLNLYAYIIFFMSVF